MLFWAVVIGPIGAILAIPLTLVVRLILVDTNRAMDWIRPMLGELDQTKAIMAQFDAEAKAARKARRAEKAAAGRNGGGGVSPDSGPGTAAGTAT